MHAKGFRGVDETIPITGTMGLAARIIKEEMSVRDLEKIVYADRVTDKGAWPSGSGTRRHGQLRRGGNYGVCGHSPYAHTGVRMEGSSDKL